MIKHVLKIGKCTEKMKNVVSKNHRIYKKCIKTFYITCSLTKWIYSLLSNESDKSKYIWFNCNN